MSVHERAVGATVEWYTPPSLFDALGLTFDLDVASPGAEKVPWIPARRHLTRSENGLASDWGNKFVWLNPPYGASLPAFVEKMTRHRYGVLLIAARTETRAFQQAASYARAACFLRDRLHFIRADGFQARSSFGSVLFVFGSDEARRAVRDASLGWYVER